MSLTVHIPLKNNDKTIDACLESLVPLGGKIIGIDLGNRDKTLEICEKRGVKIVKTSLNHNFSEARNKVLSGSDGMILSINPWEILMQGHEEIINCDPGVYDIKIISGELMTQEVRLWDASYELQFRNPVFESVDHESTPLPIYMVSHGSRLDLDFGLEAINQWIKRTPKSPDPYYYKACLYLQHKQYKQFLVECDHFFFRVKKNSMPLAMAHYYAAMIRLHMFKEVKTAIEHIKFSIAVKPNMAEFWCVAADCQYKNKEFKKAKSLYQNAIWAGEQRMYDDKWPIEASKYKKYPSSMMEQCDEILRGTRIYKPTA